MDNGTPWGLSTASASPTRLSLWLIRLGIRISHSRPGHPQTQGKLERFHRTLKAELLTGRNFKTHLMAQVAFDEWRKQYNCESPHQAIGMAVPIESYVPSHRLFPECLSEIEYGSEDIIRKVQRDGLISYKGRYYWIGKALSN